MQSIWSVPQAQAINTKVSSKRKIGFSDLMKEVFLTKTSSRTYAAPAMGRPYYAQPAYNQPAQEAYVPAQNNFFAQSAFSMKKEDVKKSGSMLILLLPMVIAFLGIPFYLMVILKFIGMFQ